MQRRIWNARAEADEPSQFSGPVTDSPDLAPPFASFVRTVTSLHLFLNFRRTGPQDRTVFPGEIESSPDFLPEYS